MLQGSGSGGGNAAAAGKDAWAVIGVAAGETQAVIDGVLTLGVLWLHTCREQSGGRRLYRGLRVVVPRGTGDLTLSRLAWMNPAAAGWELLELDERTEELTERHPADHGNLRTRLVHHLDERAAAERFREAIMQVMSLVPAGEESRVEQRLLSAGELVFALHGLVFARVHVGMSPNSFAHTLEITVGAGTARTALTEANREELRELVAELFERRRGRGQLMKRPRLDMSYSRRIGPATTAAAHARLQSRFGRAVAEGRAGSTQDPLYRAAPERWLESVLRADLAPLTRGLGPALPRAGQGRTEAYANEADPDTRGNRPDTPIRSSSYPATAAASASRVIPRLDPRHIYTQVPAIAGAGDRGMLDLLGVTVDGRLAVIELKAGDDLQLALQGLDYWIRVRHHHAQPTDPATGLGELQRHGYFTDVPLSPLPPRLYLVAPALHIHPATETVLRYVSPRVEWTLLALDERWREQVRVVWRKSGGQLG